MLEELQAFALLALVVTHGFLVRGCMDIRTELPHQGSEISHRIDKTSELLDEMAQLISDFADNTAEATKSVAPESPFGLILNSLMNRSTMDIQHGTTQERQVYETQDNSQDETFNQS